MVQRDILGCLGRVYLNDLTCAHFNNWWQPNIFDNSKNNSTTLQPPLSTLPVWFYITHSMLGHTHYILWSSDPDRCDFDLSEEGKKIKNQICSHFFFLSEISEIFYDWNSTDHIKKTIVSACYVGGKIKNKDENLVFSLVGGNFRSSEDSLTIEYNECALTVWWLELI